MAHNLSKNADGSTSFASTQPAWHGLGQIVEKAMTAEEAIKQAKLDYLVGKVNVFAKPEGFGEQIVPNKFATCRMDNGQPLGIVGSKYEIVQNKDAFSFFDSIVGPGQAIYETAGALGVGERIFITAKMPSHIRIKGTDDLTEVFVLLTSAHDASGAIIGCVTPVRVVCNNTLNMALRGTLNKVHVRHTKNVQDKLLEAHKVLGIVNKYVEEANDCFNMLAKKKLKDDAVPMLIEQLFGAQKEDSTRMKNIKDAVLACYHNGAGQEKIVGTAWGFYNGLTYYFDHVCDYRTAESKFDAIMEGRAFKKTNEALELLIQM